MEMPLLHKTSINRTSMGKGAIFAALSYLMWGILPLYWKTLSAINSLHILGFRIVFSLVLVSGILLIRKNTSWLRFYIDRRLRVLMILAGITISFNWGLYIWAVNSWHTIETSLGYYISPLISIVFGLIFFKEKLSVLQILSFCLAAVGVLFLTIFTGRPPWVSLGLAISFAFYGLLKKTVSLSALESLAVETLVSFPLGILLFLTSFGTAINRVSINFPDPHSLSYILKLPIHTLLLLLVCGAATTLPLFLFSKGAKMLPLSTLGFIQFLSPTLSFLTGFFIFHEYFPAHNFIAFGFIWTAAILYIISLKFSGKTQAK
jgi:chloramphenicol-sensitive protein RarD